MAGVERFDTSHLVEFLLALPDRRGGAGRLAFIADHHFVVNTALTEPGELADISSMGLAGPPVPLNKSSHAQRVAAVPSGSRPNRNRSR